MSRSAAPTGPRLLPVPGESVAGASGAGLPGRGVPARHAPDQSQPAGAAAGTNRNVTVHEGGGNRMPQPRRHLDNAAKQRAYRVRQDLARQEQQQAKGLPPTPPLPTIPARARWQALLTHARVALETVQTEVQAYWDERSEAWQESDRGSAMAEDLEQLAVVLDGLAELAAASGPTSLA